MAGTGMGKGKHRLTAPMVRNAKAAGLLHDGEGLYLQVTVSADEKRVRKSWLLRYVSPDTRKRREMGLGSAADISLAARKYRGDQRVEPAVRYCVPACLAILQAPSASRRSCVRYSAILSTSASGPIAMYLQ
jgi:hypothetical protein